MNQRNFGFLKMVNEPIIKIIAGYFSVVWLINPFTCSWFHLFLSWSGVCLFACVHFFVIVSACARQRLITVLACLLVAGDDVLQGGQGHHRNKTQTHSLFCGPVHGLVHHLTGLSVLILATWSLLTVCSSCENKCESFALLCPALCHIMVKSFVVRPAMKSISVMYCGDIKILYNHNWMRVSDGRLMGL